LLRKQDIADTSRTPDVGWESNTSQTHHSSPHTRFHALRCRLKTTKNTKKTRNNEKIGGINAIKNMKIQQKTPQTDEQTGKISAQTVKRSSQTSVLNMEGGRKKGKKNLLVVKRPSFESFSTNTQPKHTNKHTNTTNSVSGSLIFVLFSHQTQPLKHTLNKRHKRLTPLQHLNDEELGVRKTYRHMQHTYALQITNFFGSTSYGLLTRHWTTTGPFEIPLTQVFRGFQ